MAPALERLLRLPLVPLLGPADNTLPVVYAGNVATAICLAAEAGRAATTFDVAFDHPLRQRDLMEWLAAGLGLTPRFATVPAALVRGGGALLAQLGIGTPGAKHLPINRVTHLALGDNPFRSQLIRDELGWNPPYGHCEALERTGRSLRR
jgi:nucleoside-diphosphate-sugar epimerase